MNKKELIIKTAKKQADCDNANSPYYRGYEDCKKDILQELKQLDESPAKITKLKQELKETIIDKQSAESLMQEMEIGADILINENNKLHTENKRLKKALDILLKTDYCEYCQGAGNYPRPKYDKERLLYEAEHQLQAEADKKGE